MAKEKPSNQRKMFGIRIEELLMREVKHLAVDEGKAANDLVEEALRDLLKKYKKK